MKGEQKQKLLSVGILPCLIAAFGMLFSIIGANSACCYIFHQPDKPDMKKLRRF